MIKFYVIACSYLLSVSVHAQNSVPIAEEVVKPKGSAAAVTVEGVKEGRMNVIIQNASTGDVSADQKYKLDTLKADADKNAHVDPIFKQRQFELGAEMLPYLAPWLNEIAKPCMDEIKVGEKDALTKSAECTAKAVQVFKSNPTAFINRLPASDRAKLEALTQEKLKSSTAGK